MKKIIAILFILLSGCIEAYSPLQVTKVEYCGEECSKKYRIVVNGNVIIYTDSLYKVGDILK